MSRQQIFQPVWAWVCDVCGAIASERADDLAFRIDKLPDVADMANRGWGISADGGAICPACQSPPPEDDAA